MLRHELVTEAQSFLEDPVYWDAGRLTPFFNRCQRDIALRFGVLVSAYTTFQSVVSQQSYMIPNDFSGNETILFDHNGTVNKLHLRTKPDDLYENISEPTEEGTPSRAFLWAKEDRPELWIYPTFDTSGVIIEWYYWRRPPNINLPNDEPMIPRDLHTYMVDYAANLAMSLDGERGWTAPSFINWWSQAKLEMQITETIREQSGQNIRFGELDDGAGVSGTNYNFRIADTGWGA